jgi:hypothetical protein
MGLAVLDLAPPRSMNASPARSSRGAGLARHRAKRALEADLARLMLAAAIPRPIPGDRARATAELLFPTDRRRDEGNYRTALEKALGDALAPHDPESPFRWLTDDTPAHFTFGAVTFGLTDVDHRGRRRPAVCLVRIVWGDELIAELERELADLKGAA